MSGKYAEGNYDNDKILNSIQRVADVLQEKTLTDTYNSLQENQKQEIVERFIEKENYALDKVKNVMVDYSKNENEYLVDGAVLTCNQATEDIVYIVNGNVEDIYNIEDKSTKSLLKVTENNISNNELKMATVADAVLNKNVNPFRCNCKILPDRASELKILRSNNKKYKKEGTCSALINLNEQWENMPSIQPYFKYEDDSTGQNREGINMMSVLFCKHGGFIYPVNSGQVMSEEDILEKRIMEIEGEILNEDVIVNGNKSPLDSMFMRSLPEVTARMIYQEMHLVKDGGQTKVMWVVVNRIFTQDNFTKGNSKTLENILLYGGFESIKNNNDSQFNAFHPDYESDGWKNAKRLAASLYALVENKEGSELDEKYVRETLAGLQDINGNNLVNEIGNADTFYGNGTENIFYIYSER